MGTPEAYLNKLSDISWMHICNKFNYRYCETVPQQNINKLSIFPFVTFPQQNINKLRIFS